MVNYFTLPFLWVLVLEPNQKLFEGPVCLEVGLYIIFAAYMFDALPQALNVWDDHVTHTESFPWEVSLLAIVTGGAGSLCCGTNMVIVASTTLLVTIYYFVLYFINGPPWVFTLTRASLRCCNSSFKSSREVHTTLALWVSVSLTLCLADRLTIPL